MAYVQTVYLFKEIHKEDIPKVGGKGANLGEMANANFPVPGGFVVSAQAYFQFIEEMKLKSRIVARLKDLNVEDNEALQKASQEVRDWILNTPMSQNLKADITKYYAKLGERKLVGNISTSDEVFVAVRSSATAEDLATASFAGQQDTYLNVKGSSDVINAVQRCWASLFNARAVYYRQRQGFDTETVGIAVVVQRMVNSETSGIMFTADPATSDVSKIIVEGGYGLGEAIVSGSVTPDSYTVDKESLAILDKKINTQEWKFDRALQGNKKVTIDKSEQSVQKISDEMIQEIARVGRAIEEHYGRPQDIEWAIERHELFIVQSRAITTLEKKAGVDELQGKNLKEIVKGIAASPGVAVGVVKIILEAKDIGRVKKGDIICTVMTNPDWVPAMEKAKAIITDEGGKTSHAAIVSRELGIPAIVGCSNATSTLHDGQMVTVDGYTGKIYDGAVLSEKDAFTDEENQLVEKQAESDLHEIESMLHSEEKKARQMEELHQSTKEVADHKIELLEELLGYTAVRVKVNVALPDTAQKAAKTGADGVGLLRAEHLITHQGKHPAQFLREGNKQGLKEVVKNGLRSVAKAFAGKPVWYRTFDARTDEYMSLEGGDKEPKEANPMMGWHGIRRDLDEPDMLKCQLEAIKELQKEGFTNIGVMIPFVQNVKELQEAKRISKSIGLIPHTDVEFGIMVETPGAVWTIDAFIEEGIDFVSFGTNDLTQLTLGIDRNNEKIQKWFTELHPAIVAQLQFVIQKCKAAKVKTSICGQAGSNPEMIKKLVRFGINSVSANIDAVHEIKKAVAEEEKTIIMEKLNKS